MQKKTIFLLQPTKEANEQLLKQFNEQTDFEIVGMTTDGISAISAIADKKPMILLTELVVSGYDGLSVVRKVKEMKLNTKIVILTAFCSDEILSKALGAGADYFIAKPIDFSVLKERLEEIVSAKSEPQMQMGNAQSGFHQVSLEEKISKIFINVGIPPHIKGYSFLREGVKMAVNDPEIINNITKKLYPSIGEKYNTTPSKVERAIRHAIEVAWNRGRIETINNILGVRAYIGAEKPTNGEFIALVADKMLLEKM